MLLLSTLAAVLFVTCDQHASASTILFQASPTVIHPVLTKSLKLRCAVEKEPGTNLARRRDVQAVQAATTTVAPTHASSTQFSTAVPTSVASATRASTTHRPIIAHANVSHITSILVSRQDRVTGKLQTVAMISSYDSASASVDLDIIKVEGNTDGSPISREKGYLEMTWDYPADAQSGEYFCDIYALDTTLRPVSLAAAISIPAPQATFAELAGFVAQNQKYVTQLQQSLAHVTAQLTNLQKESQALNNTIDSLQKESRTEIQALNNMIDSLRNTTDHAKAQNIQTGSITCSNTFVTFPQPYERTPTVFVSIFDFQSTSSNYNWNLAVAIQSLNTTGFIPYCTRTYITTNGIRWIAIDN